VGWSRKILGRAWQPWLVGLGFWFGVLAVVYVLGLPILVGVISFGSLWGEVLRLLGICASLPGVGVMSWGIFGFRV
jgi:hypothetical protein